MVLGNSISPTETDMKASIYKAYLMDLELIFGLPAPFIKETLSKALGRGQEL